MSALREKIACHDNLDEKADAGNGPRTVPCIFYKLRERTGEMSVLRRGQKPHSGAAQMGTDRKNRKKRIGPRGIEACAWAKICVDVPIQTNSEFNTSSQLT